MASNSKKTPAANETPVIEDQANAPATTDEVDNAPAEAAADPKADTEAAPVQKDPKQSKAKAVAESTEGLVKMHKDGTHLHVHPTTVEDHKSVGWKVA